MYVLVVAISGGDVVATSVVAKSAPSEGHSNLSPLSLSSPEFGGGIAAAARYLLWQPVPFIVRATATRLTRFVCGWFCPDLVLLTEVYKGVNL